MRADRKRTAAKAAGNWKSLRFVAGSIATIAVTGFSTYAAWEGLRPRISVELGPASAQAFSPNFIIRNEGILPARSVVFACLEGGRYRHPAGTYWDPGGVARPSHEEEEQYSREIGDLKGNESISRRCLVNTPPPGFKREEGSFLIPMIFYQNFRYLPYSGFAQRFVSTGVSDDIAWLPDGRGLAIKGYDRNASDEKAPLKDVDVTGRLRPGAVVDLSK